MTKKRINFYISEEEENERDLIVYMRYVYPSEYYYARNLLKQLEDGSKKLIGKYPFFIKEAFKKLIDRKKTLKALKKEFRERKKILRGTKKRSN